MTDEKYSQLFPKAKRKEAFRVALDVRKFEIELYWKRAAYFCNKKGQVHLPKK